LVLKIIFKSHQFWIFVVFIFVVWLVSFIFIFRFLILNYYFLVTHVLVLTIKFDYMDLAGVKFLVVILHFNFDFWSHQIFVFWEVIVWLDFFKVQIRNILLLDVRHLWILRSLRILGILQEVVLESIFFSFSLSDLLMLYFYINRALFNGDIISSTTEKSKWFWLILIVLCHLERHLWNSESFSHLAVLGLKNLPSVLNRNLTDKFQGLSALHTLDSFI